MQPKTFRYEERGAIAAITLNRPERLNALTFDVYAELRELFESLSNRSDIRAVVISGAGRAFCSGGDVRDIIGELVGRDTAGLLEFTRMTGALTSSIRQCSKPVIAAVNGIAAGGGAVIALACDFRLGTPNTSFAFLFTRIGLTGADMGAAYLLPRIVGLARASEILFLGDTIPADDALRIGLLNRIVPPDDLEGNATALAERLVKGPALALGMTKRLINHALDLDFAAAIEAEAEGQALCMQTRHFREAYEAFVSKRPPVFD